MTELVETWTVASLVNEYEGRLAALKSVHEECERVAGLLSESVSVGGHYGRVDASIKVPSLDKMEAKLLSSAWLAAYERCKIRHIAPKKDREGIELGLENPPPFTFENVKGTFGKYVENPRLHILRGLAEAFSCLDPAYKSHSKVKIGVKGLPKRVIFNNVGGWSGGWELFRDCMNALGRVQGFGDILYKETDAIKSALYRGWSASGDILGGEYNWEARGLRLKGFANGNLHVFFDDYQLKVINESLAEYYGDVLPDETGEKPSKRRGSTELSKDLQFYPTPAKVADTILGHKYVKGQRILEPSCGEGAIMKALVRHGADPKLIMGIEVDTHRAQVCRSAGFSVMTANFLDLAPRPEYDFIFMNPPFYGRHYLKHIEKALQWLAPGGELVSVLPATAHYDHGQLPPGGWWTDLPVGSFAESGTRVPTGYWSYTRKER